MNSCAPKNRRRILFTDHLSERTALFFAAVFARSSLINADFLRCSRTFSFICACSSELAGRRGMFIIENDSARKASHKKQQGIIFQAGLKIDALLFCWCCAPTVIFFTHFKAVLLQTTIRMRRKKCHASIRKSHLPSQTRFAKICLLRAGCVCAGSL